MRLINAIQQHIKSGGTATRLDDRPEFPLELEHVWKWFIEIDSARQQGMAPNPISYAEIDAWNRLTGVCVTPFEVRCLRILDRVRLEFVDNG